MMENPKANPDGTTTRWALPDLEHALAWCRERAGQDIRCTLHVLDEYTRSVEEADAVAASYRDVIAGISGSGLTGAISVKLSSLGALTDGDGAMERVYSLCRDAHGKGVGFEIDMEGKGLMGAAIEAAALCGRKGLPVTLALQAYLYRTQGDLRLVLAMGATPRFVKGAYLGDISDFSRIEERFLALVKEAERYEVSFHVGTHDPVLLDGIRTLMDTNRDRIEFGFLLGLADRTKLEMAAEGWHVSEYVPFGNSPDAYVVRRERYLRELEQQKRSPAL